MRCLLIILICCLLDQAVSRPAGNQENESELGDVDYERSDETAAEDAPSDEEAPLSDQSSQGGDQEDTVDQQELFNGNEYSSQRGRSPPEERDARKSSYNNVPEYKLDGKIQTRDVEPDVKNEDLSNYKRGRSGFDRYMGNNPDDQLVPNPDNLSGGFENTDVRNEASRDRANSKCRSEVQPDDSSDLLFENRDYKEKQLGKVKKNDRIENSAELAEQPHLYKKYHDSLKYENNEFEDNQNYENRQDESNRDRRAVPVSRSDESSTLESKDSDNKGSSTMDIGEDQAAIKRHIKKLTNNELDDLLHSLSQDKRALLQTIIDSDTASNPQKREITKKAGAVEENNYLDGGQDSNKVSGPSLNMNTEIPASQNTDSTEASKSTTTSPSDIGDMSSSTKNIESNNIGFCGSKDSINVNEETATDKLGSGSIAPTAETVNSKTENKREINPSVFSNDESYINDFNDNESPDPSNDQSYVCSQNEDLSQLTDEELQHYENGNTQKRDTLQESNVDFSDTMKSLQESFPNSNAYDDSGPYTGSDMEPLIRVKRRNNHAVKKRAAAILPQSQEACVPYRAENEDEDSDEGNEFYDDGFFDRTASFAKSNVNKLSESRRKIFKLNTKGNSNAAKRSNIVNKVNSDTMSIGSDTDSVLSGVEGVDENLMYNGGARKKRAAERSTYTKLEPAENLINEDLRTCPQSSTTTTGDSLKELSDFTDGVQIPIDEAFGPLPRNYDGELSRYKRIRRLKQSTDTKELSLKNANIQ